MMKPAGREAEATEVPPAEAVVDDPFGLAPWLKDMPQVAIPPLMAHPVAAMAAVTAIGFGISSHLAGAVIGAMQGGAERMKAALDKAAQAESEALEPEGAAPGKTFAAVATLAEPVEGEKPAVVPAKVAQAAGAKDKGARHAGARKPAAGATAPAAKKMPAEADVRPAATRTKTPATVRKGSGSIAGKADDLKLISGIGPKLEQVLNGKGIFRFADIARWSASDEKRIEAELGLDGRIARDGWVEQARTLAKA